MGTVAFGDLREGEVTSSLAPAHGVIDTRAERELGDGGRRDEKVIPMPKLRKVKAPTVEDILAEMPEPLRKKVEEAERLRTPATRADVTAKFRIAQMVVAIKDDADKYGKAGVQQFARALGVDKSGLYKDANVVDKWKTLAAIKKELARGRVTWSHFVVLATVSSEPKRKRLLNDVRMYGWTVAELERQLNPALEQNGDDEDGAEQGSTFPASASRIVADFERLTGRKPLLNDFITKLDELDDGIGAVGFESLQRLEKAVGETEELARACRDKVSKAVERLKHLAQEQAAAE